MAKPDVTQKEVDDAFYKSYEGMPGGMDPALKGPGGKGYRPLTMDPKDARFRECWMETRRLMRAERGLCVPEGAPIGTPATPCMKKGPKKDNPKYEPAAWNDGDGQPIQSSTNCYAYAMDSRTGHAMWLTPQPGEASGSKPGSPYKCEEVTKAVVADGKPDYALAVERCPYNKQQKKPPPDKPGYYLVALVTTPEEGFDAAGTTYHHNDYHWYRQDDDGTWSHKPGTTAVRNVDSNGALITNPEMAAKRTVYPTKKYNPKTKKMADEVLDYSNFCGYMYVKKGGAPVK